MDFATKMMISNQVRFPRSGRIEPHHARSQYQHETYITHTSHTSLPTFRVDIGPKIV